MTRNTIAAVAYAVAIVVALAGAVWVHWAWLFASVIFVFMLEATVAYDTLKSRSLTCQYTCPNCGAAERLEVSVVLSRGGEEVANCRGTIGIDSPYGSQ